MDTKSQSRASAVSDLGDMAVGIGCGILAVVTAAVVSYERGFNAAKEKTAMEKPAMFKCIKVAERSA